MESVWKKIIALKPDYNILPFEEVYTEKMDKVYWIICYYNLKEKWLCSGISSDDWKRIEELNLFFIAKEGQSMI